MKKFGNVVLTIVMLCLIMLLCVNLSIKTMSTKAITNAVVVQEASNGIEEVLNQAFPDVSNENIKKVEEAVKNNSALNDVTSDLLDQITAAVANGSDVDTAAIAAQLSKAVDENIPNRRFPIVNSIALTTNGINKPTTIPEITAAIPLNKVHL